MNVGVCKLKVRLPENQSLKGKRKVITSLCSKLHNRFNVSVSEVDNNEAWQLATLGLTCVSNDSRHIDKLISTIINFIENNVGTLEIVSEERETITGF